ncbi:hypothetical protein ACHQM5_002501 [Ranunculus cassubicifolius]
MGSNANMFFAFVLVGMALIHSTTAQTAHVVGGTTGWSTPADPAFYSTWAATQTFNVGDSLTFNFDSTHDVGEVTKAGYDACDSSTTIGASQASSPVTITLTAPGLKYYICSFHCSSGQKLAVTVLAAAASPPPAASTTPPPPALVTPPPTSASAPPPAITTPPPTSAPPPTNSTVPPASSAIPPTSSPPRSDNFPPTVSPPAPSIPAPPSNSATPPNTSPGTSPSANEPSPSSTSQIVVAFSATFCSLAVALFF